MRSASKKRLGKDPAYLAFLHELPCAICLAGEQKSKTEAAHVGDRGYSQKCPDRYAMPLCGFHHRTGPKAHHVLGKHFWAYHGIDRDELLTRLWNAYELIQNSDKG